MKVIICGTLPFDVVPLAVALEAAGYSLAVVNAEGAQQALRTAAIPFQSDGSAGSVLSDLAQVEIVVAGLGDHSLGQVDVGTHALLRASAAQFERVVVVTDAEDCELVKSRILEGPSLSLSLQQRRLLAAKAFSACAAVDNRIAVELHQLSSQQALVLVVGAGGREHALAVKLAESRRVSHVFVAPGNGGTATAGGKISNVNIKADNDTELVNFAKERGVALVVVGPEAPLVAGLSDAMSAAGIPCFGPSAQAARLEASKAFTKDFMARHGIRTARYQNFNEFEACKQYIESLDYPVVVKFSGLAAGKGVIIPANKDEAVKAARDMLVGNVFGAGGEVVIEEMMEGPEVSVLAFCDGVRAVGMPAAQDHKRALDGDNGLNTGGMGAYAPAPVLTPALRADVMAQIQRTVDGMAEEGCPFEGVLFAGLMLTKDGPSFLEYNVRFGDPETQVLLPLLDSDLFEIMLSCVERRLKEEDVRWKSGAAATVVLASGGYPESYPTGLRISGLENAASIQNVTLYHAGTKLGENGEILTSGGRVLAVTGMGRNIKEAVSSAYSGVHEISFERMHFRSDIAHRALNMPLRLGVIGSTRGSALQPIIDAIESGTLNARIEIVVSNKHDAPILERASRHHIPNASVSAKGKSREDFDREVSTLLADAGVELVLMIGYMRIVSASFCETWKDRCLNVHPSLLPDFAGGMDLQVHEAVIQAGKRKSGCTVHFVTEMVDGGPIAVQKEVSVEPGETPESLKAKVQPLEGVAFIEAINKFMAGEIGPATKTVMRYKDAGVDIVAGDQLVEMIKPACAATARPGCDASLGGFGALFDLAAAGYDPADTLLVSGTDGVGTKLVIAQQTGIHATIGIDLVAMSVNDVLVTGAEPLFFLDYFGCGKLDLGVGAQVVIGIAEGCKISNCGLIGGETAEMPSMYPPGEYDLAGFAVGAVRKSHLLPKNIVEGDVVLGLPSSGVHSNGYSLVRKCVERSGLSYQDEAPFLPGKRLGEALLVPTRIYVSALMGLIKAGLVNGMAHITGGGLLENVPRVVPEDLAVFVDLNEAGWILPPVFKWLMEVSGIDQTEMLTTFNCGVGMVLLVSRDNASAVQDRLRAMGEEFMCLGCVGRRPDPSSPQVIVSGRFL